jgi:hypothetical protein
MLYMRMTQPQLTLYGFLTVLGIIILRGADLYGNGAYLMNHPSYWTVYYLGILTVLGGILVLIFYEIESPHRHFAGILFGLLGVTTIILDPDFTHFLRDPIIFLSTDLVFTGLLLIGTPLLAILFFIACKALIIDHRTTHHLPSKTEQ